MKEENESLKGRRIAAHVCRMLVEYRTLNKRIRNLDSFLKDHPDTEESHEQELQLAAMRLYAYHLCKRIRLHGIEDPLCEHLEADPDVMHKAYMAYPAIYQVSDGKELVKGPDDLNLDCRQAYLKGYCQAEEDWNELKEMRGEQKPALDVEIPFGAKDSELEEVFYSIPNGFHAEVIGDKVVIKKGEQKPTTNKYNVGATIFYNSFGEIKSMVVANVVDVGDGNPMYEDADGNAVFEKDLFCISQ